MSSSELLLRPHHGMCMAYYQGHGYSKAFNSNMNDLLHRLRSAPVQIRLTVGGDAVCRCCPNLRNGKCITCEKSDAYDRGVLALCGLQEGEVLDAEEFFRKVRRDILNAGRREQICGNCRWNHLCQSLPESFLEIFHFPLDK